VRERGNEGSSGKTYQEEPNRHRRPWVKRREEKKREMVGVEEQPSNGQGELIRPSNSALLFF
jgi:hypothetical protein